MQDSGCSDLAVGHEIRKVMILRITATCVENKNVARIRESQPETNFKFSAVGAGMLQCFFISPACFRSLIHSHILAPLA